MFREHPYVHIPVFSIVVVILVSLLIFAVVIYNVRRKKRSPAERGRRYVDVGVKSNGD